MLLQGEVLEQTSYYITPEMRLKRYSLSFGEVLEQTSYYITTTPIIATGDAVAW